MQTYTNRNTGAVLPPLAGKFGRELTLPSYGKDEYLIERTLMDRLAGILASHAHNNAILTGGAGVGKTALVEAFGRELVRGGYPGLRGRRIVEISLDGLLKDCRGPYDAGVLLKNLFEEAARSELILFIDEGHRLCSNGADSVGNIAKPFLTRGDIQVITATTVDEYRKYVEGDAALSRRFEAVRIAAPSKDRVLQILRNVCEARYPGIALSEEAAEKLVNAGRKYLPERNDPDRAISLLDFSAGWLRSLGQSSELGAEAVNKALAVRFGNSQGAAALTAAGRQRYRDLPDKLNDLLSSWPAISEYKEAIMRAVTRTARHRGPLIAVTLAGEDASLLEWIARQTAALMGYTDREILTCGLESAVGYSNRLAARIINGQSRVLIFKGLSGTGLSEGSAARLSQLLCDGVWADLEGRAVNCSSIPVFVIYETEKEQKRACLGFNPEKSGGKASGLTFEDEQLLRAIIGRDCALLCFSSEDASACRPRLLETFLSGLARRARALGTEGKITLDNSAQKAAQEIITHVRGWSELTSLGEKLLCELALADRQEIYKIGYHCENFYIANQITQVKRGD
ncbi:MAG: AAA family ATPase [Synergistaceae bacterium]|nr:AAA family ATPase [Synergistaceae bacterium]